MWNYGITGINTADTLYIISNTFEDTVEGLWLASTAVKNECMIYVNACGKMLAFWYNNRSRFSSNNLPKRHS